MAEATAALDIAYHKLEIQHSHDDFPDLQRRIDMAKAILEERRKQYDALTTEAADRQAKIAQLVQDELIVRKQQQEAVKSRFKLQRRLSDVGGHENALKILIATLAATKEDVLTVRQTKATLSAAHKDLEKEAAMLTVAVQKAKSTIESYNRERQAIEAKKLEADGKLAKIAAFLTAT
ncbi:hypothetical protein H310_14790 [Aphanomyces invadans]|uniref:Uncharacterized protein n=1 Tax=Aphanomyces invadans TaxID=157072 RepID=A0A024TAU6_9STRA|nr:hypothetical protein H310_14790 [Aphanomyces invadans]ETV90422.1 hypothetical protein H310_14790 [Aphanomyces invadans]|eukprot:XP_008880941.1 hypothetical protein H310_14790 [Aphanomyces invadans]